MIQEQLINQVGRPRKSKEQKLREKKEIKKELVEQRQKVMGLYSIDELAMAFGISRKDIDDKINSGKLAWFSPNGKKRFIRLNDYLETFKYSSIEV